MHRAGNGGFLSSSPDLVAAGEPWEGGGSWRLKQQLQQNGAGRGQLGAEGEPSLRLVCGKLPEGRERLTEPAWSAVEGKSPWVPAAAAASSLVLCSFVVGQAAGCSDHEVLSCAVR